MNPAGFLAVGWLATLSLGSGPEPPGVPPLTDITPQARQRGKGQQ